MLASVGVAAMPSVTYLRIALFTELFNLSRRDVPVLITVSTLVQSQASADSTFPRSWMTKTHLFWLHKSSFRHKKERKKRVPSSRVSSSDSSEGFHYQMPRGSETPSIGETRHT